MSRPEWYMATAQFEKSIFRKSGWQIINTLGPYFLLWFLIVRAMQLGYPYWVILLMTIPAGLFMVRLFILFHDCAYQSFFSSKRANRIFGYILVIVLLAGFTTGFRTYVLIQLPILFIGGMLGLWLFYVQHNFDGMYWSRHDEWDQMKAAMEGSSFYRLPKVLDWFTGNIGYHHIHHIRPLIPNYRLEECYKVVSNLKEIEALTIRKSFRSLRLHLWDEIDKKLVSFHSL